jgi:hypothetical protein
MLSAITVVIFRVVYFMAKLYRGLNGVFREVQIAVQRL